MGCPAVILPPPFQLIRTCAHRPNLRNLRHLITFCVFSKRHFRNLRNLITFCVFFATFGVNPPLFGRQPNVWKTTKCGKITTFEVFSSIVWTPAKCPKGCKIAEIGVKTAENGAKCTNLLGVLASKSGQNAPFWP